MSLVSVTPELQLEIERFLYKEASLLDDRKFEEWLSQLTDDVQYFVPVRETLEENDGVRKFGEMALFMDGKDQLQLRIARLGTGLAHAETPPSRTRHNLSNILLTSVENGISVRANITVSVCRLERTEVNYYGMRRDELRMADGEWKIARREVILDQSVLPRSISVLF